LACGGILDKSVIQLHFCPRFWWALRSPLYFWRDKMGNEVDLLIDYADHVLSIEIKSGRTASSSFFDGLTYFAKYIEVPTKERMVIYAGDEMQLRSSGRLVSWRQLYAPDELFKRGKQ